MNISKYIPAIVILYMLAAAGCRMPDKYSKSKTMMISADGEVETTPDMATFTVNLSCLNKTVKESKQCLVEKSNELNKALLGFGIKQEDILTTAVNLNKNYTYTNTGRIFEGYNSSTSLYITIKDLDKLDDIYTELLENRNLEIGGLSYSHSKMDSLKNEAYTKALKNSQALADKLSSGKKEILQISNVEISSAPQPVQTRMAEMGMMAAKNQSISVSTGTIKVNATLFVEYWIK